MFWNAVKAKRNFDAVWDQELACAMRAEGATIAEIARHFGVTTTPVHNRVKHVICRRDRKREQLDAITQQNRERNAERIAAETVVMRRLRAAGMTIPDICRTVGRYGGQAEKRCQGVKPKHFRGRRSHSVRAARKPENYAVPAWVRSAGLQEDYRDFARAFDEHRAARECRKLIAEAARP